LNMSGESGHPCLVPDIRESSFSFYPFSMMLAISLSYIAFIMLRYIPFIHVSSELLLRKDVEFCHKPFLCVLRLSFNFCLWLCLYAVLHLHILNHPYILGIKLTWSWCMIFLINFLFCYVFVWFWSERNIGFIKWVW
jgi:hypothetical protein